MESFRANRFARGRKKRAQLKLTSPAKLTLKN
jgi:hypothetical protein